MVAPLNKKTKPEEEKNFNGSALDEGASAESGLQNNGCPKFDFLIRRIGLKMEFNTFLSISKLL